MHNAPYDANDNRDKNKQQHHQTKYRFFFSQLFLRHSKCLPWQTCETCLPFIELQDGQLIR